MYVNWRQREASQVATTRSECDVTDVPMPTLSQAKCANYRYYYTCAFVNVRRDSV